jgi:hypothetical protein
MSDGTAPSRNTHNNAARSSKSGYQRSFLSRLWSRAQHREPVAGQIMRASTHVIYFADFHRAMKSLGAEKILHTKS